MTLAAIIITAIVKFVAGIAHERWARTRWIHSLPVRDPHDLLTEEF